MKRLKMCIIVLGLSFLSNFAFATGRHFEFGSEPDGFRGIKWGTNLSSLSGMQYYRTEPSLGEMQIYLRKGDKLSIGGAKLERIEYHFWKGTFSSLQIFTKGFGNWSALKKALSETFGEGFEKKLSGLDTCYWSEEHARILLIYGNKEQGKLTISSKALTDKMDAFFYLLLLINGASK